MGLVPWSDLIRRALPQDAPSSDEVAAATPVSLLPPPLTVLSVASRPTVYAVPSGPMETQGSEARSYGAPVNGSKMGLIPVTQPLKGNWLSPQVLPPSVEKPASRPCAPPFDQRSCCQTPMLLSAVCGLTATKGSSSAST